MLFIQPMWFSESQRIGKQKCSPTGYRLHVIAELIGFLGLLLLFVVPAVLVLEWVSGTFHGSLFWLFAVPFGLGIVSDLLFQYSWSLAMRRGFHYDYEQDEASWMEAAPHVQAEKVSSLIVEVFRTGVLRVAFLPLRI